MVSVFLPGDACRQITPRFALVDARDPRSLRVGTGEGWHAIEYLPGTAERWQWTGRDAILIIDNPQAGACVVRCTLDARSLGERELLITSESGEPVTPAVRLGEARAQVIFGPFTIPPGRSRWVLHSTQPQARAGPDDPRLIAVCVYNLAIAAGGN